MKGKNKKTEMRLQCPILKSDYDKILLAHGSGGTLMNQLIEKIFVSSFKNDALSQGHDGSVFEVDGKRLAMTTDSYVVHPVFFPGGDIGSLAIHGTTNDLVMCGAKPIAVSAGFILEEGFPIEDLWKIVQSMKKAADEVGVEIITGDTKVVDRGKADGVFINTTGIGIVDDNINISPSEVQVGDAIIISGDVGRHGMAIMQEREGLEFESKILSDSASLADMVLSLLKQGDIHCMRDLTRGGLASALNEIAQKRGVGIQINESAVAVEENVRGACELLGFDPFYVANEGRCIFFVPEKDSAAMLAEIKKHSLGKDAACIGVVLEKNPGRVTVQNDFGTMRILDMLTGEQLPRIC